MIDKNFLQTRATNDFLLINAARGKLVKEQELKEILLQRPLAHAYLDVFEKEPCDFSLPPHLPNLHCTSHIAGVSSELENDLLNFEKNVLENLLLYWEAPHLFREKNRHRELSERLSPDQLSRPDRPDRPDRPMQQFLI
jgi:D-3-phosphoglycerate dehydrogenase / 2-oxoglutarate reductase